MLFSQDYYIFSGFLLIGERVQKVGPTGLERNSRVAVTQWCNG